jgi:hypothetical protein
MKLTPKEEKLRRLVLDKGAPEGEFSSETIKLIRTRCARGVTAYDADNNNVATARWMLTRAVALFGASICKFGILLHISQFGTSF